MYKPVDLKCVCGCLKCRWQAVWVAEREGTWAGEMARKVGGKVGVRVAVGV